MGKSGGEICDYIIAKLRYTLRKKHPEPYQTLSVIPFQEEMLSRKVACRSLHDNILSINFVGGSFTVAIRSDSWSNSVIDHHREPGENKYPADSDLI